MGTRRGNSTNYHKSRKRVIVPYRERVDWRARWEAGLESQQLRGKVSLPEPGSSIQKQSARHPQTTDRGEKMRKP